MREIRDINQNLRYIYVWRETGEKNLFEFVADAEMLEPIDIDGNGKIEDIEIPPSPGEDYDVSDIPDIYTAFEKPIARNDFIVDKWGTFLSGFAPIKNENGDAVAIIGMDVEVGDFNKLVTATLIPFSLLAILLLLILSIQTVSLVRIWKSRVEIFKEIDRQKDELLGIVSHQLATPVSSVKWYIELLLNGDMGALKKEQAEALETMQEVSLHLTELIGMILDVSRIQLGKMKIDKQQIDTQAFFHELLDVIEPKALEKKIKFTKTVGKLPVVFLDKRLTRMVFENLLSNAVKYTPEHGEVIFEVRILNNEIYCRVKDSGCGIPKQDQDKIFGKLYRASNTRNIDGNGFGLYIAKGAVEAQGGKIWFESEENKGTTFHIQLPQK